MSGGFFKLLDVHEQNTWYTLHTESKQVMTSNR